MHTVLACGLLLQMSHIARFVCLSAYVLGTLVSCAKMAEPIQMPLGGGGRELTHGFKQPCIGWDLYPPENEHVF